MEENNNHKIKILDDYDKHTLESEKEGTPSKEGKEKDNPLKDTFVSETSVSPFLHKKWFKIFIGLLLIASFVAFVSILMGLKESKECLGNPFIYGANKIENANTGALTCNCFFSNPRYVPFMFDHNNVSVSKYEGSTAGLPSLFNVTIEK